MLQTIESSEAMRKYHWDNFAAQTTEVRLVARRQSWIVLDVVPMTRLRPDGHLFPAGGLDCLHYTAEPNGVVDHWNHQLAALLTSERAARRPDAQNATPTLLNRQALRTNLSLSLGERCFQ